jgi:hypothetical protein
MINNELLAEWGEYITKNPKNPRWLPVSYSRTKAPARG